MPDVGRFFNIDPLAEKYPYNSTYAFQENKMGMGVELEGLELLKNHTGFFAINGNAMKVKRAPVSQMNSSGQATFTAGDIGLSTTGYNPDGARFTSGSTGLRLNSYKYSVQYLMLCKCRIQEIKYLLKLDRALKQQKQVRKCGILSNTELIKQSQQAVE
ncbi:hypothetical protein IQ37_19315 [Chryseobacterium piperi]|uniref:Uncharacterized protein n=1 Tax=Chryseobacterium piperi TaxID=558152 RepID=A0A086A7I5_9FLAO|nr:hypothetical protein CJF12_04540 [Chryseobacterium piperi]KFF12649.1 hypothetical protein IQ37_19315 [Chryseobacterium piperi]